MIKLGGPVVLKHLESVECFAVAVQWLIHSISLLGAGELDTTSPFPQAMAFPESLL